jgi:hypothetical protein
MRRAGASIGLRNIYDSEIAEGAGLISHASACDGFATEGLRKYHQQLEETVDILI